MVHYEKTVLEGAREGKAMQNLRDQLLKTGLATKGQKQQVEQDKRRERKQLKKGQAEELAQEQQRQAHAARIEAQRLADRQRATELKQQVEAREKLLQLRHTIDYWKLSEEPRASRRWYFVTRHNIIKYLYVSEPTALQLRTGALAIVEHPDQVEPRYVLVERDAADVVAQVDAGYVRFYNRESVVADASEEDGGC
jgi:uncharacterized protein